MTKLYAHERFTRGVFRVRRISCTPCWCAEPTGDASVHELCTPCRLLARNGARSGPKFQIVTSLPFSAADRRGLVGRV